MQSISRILIPLLLIGFASQQGNDSKHAFSKKIDLGGYGLYLNCSAWTNKDVPTVILEAGLNNDSDTWTKVQPEIAKFARVCSYDRAGMGTSDPAPAKPGTSQQIVRDLHLLLERAGINGPFVLVGHSFGGLIVRMFASSYPKEVAGMVLVDSVHEEESEKWLSLLPPETRKQMEASGGRQIRGGEAIDLETSFKQMQSANWRTGVPLIVLSRGRASFSVDDYPPALRSLAPKGEELRLEMQRDLATRSTNSKFVFAERSGHMIQLDEPEVVVNAIREVIQSTKLKPTKP